MICRYFNYENGIIEYDKSQQERIRESKKKITQKNINIIIFFLQLEDKVFVLNCSNEANNLDNCSFLKTFVPLGESL